MRGSILGGRALRIARPACGLLVAALLLPATAHAQDRDTEAGRRAIVERSVAAIKADHP